MNNIGTINKAEEKHKEIFYVFLTKFAYLDTLVAYCISSHFKKTKNEKIEITDLLISEFNSSKQFEIFLKILRLNHKPEIEVKEFESQYNKVRNMRNFLAHSYFTIENNLKYNGRGLKLTRLSNSKGIGYTENFDLTEYEVKKIILENLVSQIHQIVTQCIQKDI